MEGAQADRRIAAGQVDHRRKTEIDAAGAQLAGHDPGMLLGQPHRFVGIAVVHRADRRQRRQAGEAVAEALHRAAFLIDRDQQLFAADLADRFAQRDQLLARGESCGRTAARRRRRAPCSQRFLVLGQFQSRPHRSSTCGVSRRRARPRDQRAVRMRDQVDVVIARQRTDLAPQPGRPRERRHRRPAIRLRPRPGRRCRPGTRRSRTARPRRARGGASFSSTPSHRLSSMASRIGHRYRVFELGPLDAARGRLDVEPGRVAGQPRAHRSARGAVAQRLRADQIALRHALAAFDARHARRRRRAGICVRSRCPWRPVWLAVRISRARTARSTRHARYAGTCPSRRRTVSLKPCWLTRMPASRASEAGWHDT